MIPTQANLQECRSSTDQQKTRIDSIHQDMQAQRITLSACATQRAVKSGVSADIVLKWISRGIRPQPRRIQLHLHVPLGQRFCILQGAGPGVLLFCEHRQRSLRGERIFSSLEANRYGRCLPRTSLWFHETNTPEGQSACTVGYS